MTLSDLKTKLQSKYVREEATFFVLGVLPYWYTLWLPSKSTSYWAVLVWACIVWIIYNHRRAAAVGVVNNTVELGIAISGLAALLLR